MIRNRKAKSMKKMKLITLRHLLIVGACSSFIGCVDGAEPLLLLQNQVPTSGCLVSNSPSGGFFSRGIIDVNAGGGYLFTPVVQNKAKSNNNSERLIFVDGANIDLSFPRKDLFSDAELSSLSDSGYTKFKQRFSGNIPSGSFTSFSFEILPKGLLEEMAKKIPEGKTEEVVAFVEVLGSLDGGDVQSNPFSYPISVCNGCLMNVIGSCAAIGEAEVRTGGSCQPLQDGVIDCCTKADGALVCPAAIGVGGDGDGDGDGS